MTEIHVPVPLLWITCDKPIYQQLSSQALPSAGQTVQVQAEFGTSLKPSASRSLWANVEAAVVSFCVCTEEASKELEGIFVALNQDVGWVFWQRHNLEFNSVRRVPADLVGTDFSFHVVSMPADSSR